MQSLWYIFLRLYVRWGLHFFFRKIILHGRENIPAGPVIFAANHQNAFLDALMIVCFNSHRTHFLARADIFQKTILRWLLSTLNMIPIYRIRDGWHSLNENQKTFDSCYRLFTHNDAVVIFPEGNHGNMRRLRHLSKGFTRIAFDSLQKNPDLNISIVPVGLNYSDHQAFRGSVSVYFGKPITAMDYFKEPYPVEAGHLRDELSLRLRNLTTHIENTEQYSVILSKLEKVDSDFLNPTQTNERVAILERGESISINPSQNRAPSLLSRCLHFPVLLINLIPLILWWKIRLGIKDPVFVASLKFGFGIVVFPLYYFLVGALIYWLFGGVATAAWLAISLTSMLFYKD
ncbi:hypothetical protein BH10BAC4_BH10BAC4_09280 [soil metagenome]